MNRLKFIFPILILIYFVSASNLYARNVSCRAMDGSGKIIGTYMHTEVNFPVCSCSNKDIPAKLKKSCAKSLSSF